MRICVDRAIVGAYVVASHGDSMSGARPDSYAHPPCSPECRPRSPGKARLRRLLDDPRCEVPLHY